MHPILAGGMGGFLATVPMSAAMKGILATLPRWQQYALPPEQITVELAERAGVAGHLDPSERKAASLVNHFGYGTAMGLVFGCGSLVVKPTLMTGVVFGLGVWGTSYLVGLPALGFRASAPRQPAGRNAMMLASHAVWGLGLGAITAWATRDRSQLVNSRSPRQ